MTVLVLSMMHTGTHFVVDMLRKHKIKTISSHFFSVGVDFSHNMLTVCPVRKPEDVYVTWFSRGLNMFYFEYHWKILNDFYIGNKCLILPVDSNDKENYLEKLSSVIGVKLNTNWEPVGSKLRLKCTVPDLSSINKLQIVRDVYGLNT